MSIFFSWHMISSFLGMVLMMIAVAFYIVTERKGLGMMQMRQGPNKVSVKGFLQAVADGVKLFKKEFIFPSAVLKGLFMLGPCLCFICAYSLWVLFPASFFTVSFDYGVLLFLAVSTFSVYGVFLVGWVCDSRYAFLGAMRAIAQSISYEVFMSLVIFCPLLLAGSYNMVVLRASGSVFILVGFWVLFLWVVCMLAETNRAPFDFVEGESELVAGYTVEFGGAGFALIALAEYSNMMFMGLLTGVLFFGGSLYLSFLGDVFLVFWLVLTSYFIILVRGALPRFRYDLLMKVCWVVFLPLSLSAFLLVVGLVC